jgi:hypothetical protein
MGVVCMRLMLPALQEGSGHQAGGVCDYQASESIVLCKRPL